ncbi:MAG: SPOR domain-containing protein [Flavobacteriales bacterium]
MKKSVVLILSILLFYFVVNANDIEIKNSVLKSTNNSYQVSIKIIGKEQPGIFKLTLSIPDEYTVDVYNNVNLLIDTRGQLIKFYSNFDSGNQIEINCKLIKKDSDESEASIPVHLEYSLNGNMVVLDKEIILSDHEIITIEKMDSLSKQLEEISKQNENKDAIALAKMKNLPTSLPETANKREDLTSMPEGYNSSTKSGLSNSNKSYSVQILSLQFYNEKRLNEFLNLYKLKPSETFKKEVNGLVKIYTGKFSTYEEAKALKEKLIQQNNLTDSFVVSY